MIFYKGPFLFFILLIVLLCIVTAMTFSKYTDSNLLATHINYKNSNLLMYYRASSDMNMTKPSLALTSSFIDAMHELGIKLEMAKDPRISNFLTFETLNSIDHIIANLNPWPHLEYVYGIGGTDQIASKAMLYQNMRNLSTTIFPKTYVVANRADMLNLKHDLMHGGCKKVYILKKDIQRQSGYKLSNNADEIWALKDQYVVVQEMLTNPLIINTRKINMRVYLLVVVDKTGASNFFVYKDGFMYYTPQSYECNSMDPDRQITTGYIDRQVYIDNPLTHSDLEAFLGQPKYTKLRSNIIKCMRIIKSVYTPIFAERNLKRGFNGVCFNVFGVDIAPDDSLNCTIMEVNKGPDLSYKDKRDRDVKLQMLKDVFKLVGMVQDNNTKFDLV